MASKYKYVNIPRAWPDDNGVICSRCGARFGYHFGLTCPDKKGVFSKRVRRRVEDK